MNDVELLREYVARGCQDAFPELVRRHINLVYGTATRQVRDPHLAQEISQKVFCALAQNARSIRNPAALAAWLYRTTCQLATLHVRSEHRRIERERVAAAMNVTSNDQQDRWEEVEPLLDQALAALGDTDRLAILLRFFETKPMAEVGATLGVSEAAAKMRIGRAIEKLRIFFVRRGVTCSAAGLFLLFDRHAGAAAPPLAVEAVLQAATISSNQIPELTFKLRPASGWSGTVLLPNGEPAVDTEVGMSTFARTLILGDRRFLFREQSIIRRTDASGRFRFEPLPSERPSGRVIVAVHSQGYAEQDADRFASGLRLQLLPWGRIEGVLRSRGEPLANEKVYVVKRHWNPWTIGINLYSGQFAVRTDATGRFAFESVPPGDHQLGRAPYRELDTRLTVQARPGETTRIQVGGDGQPVTGRIVIQGRDQGFDFSNSTGLLKRQQVRPIDLPRVSRKDYPSDEAYEQAAKENAVACINYWRSAEGLEAWREQRSYGVKFEADGTFRADDVPPGEYTLRVMLNEVRAENEMRPIGMPLSGSVGVPAGVLAKHDEPVNVGIVTLKPE